MYETSKPRAPFAFIVTATALIGAADVRGQCSADCASECGGREAVYGQVTYGNIDHTPELEADGITSSCCDEHGGTGCDDATCQTAVCAVDLDCCSVQWVESCADLARQLCTPLATTNGCIDDRSSVFVRGLQEGAPVPFVTVELRGSVACGVAGRIDEDITDADGCFCVCVGGTGCATPNTLRIKAKNDHVKVKASKVVPLETNSSISTDFPIDNSAYGSGDVEYNLAIIDDYLHTFEAYPGYWFGDSWPVSRALHLCRIVQTSREHIRALTGETVDSVTVRLGYYSTAWYDAYLVLGQTIHLPGTDAEKLWHEYGHHLENRLGAFGVIPSYVLHGLVPGGPKPGHAFCCELVTTGGGWDYCWSFLEGVASWYGAINSYGFTDVSDIEFYGDPPDADTDGLPDWNVYGELYALGDNAGVEKSPCGSNGMSYTCDGNNPWTEPRAVESITANVLWDLVDTNVDEKDTHGTGIWEVAQVPVNDVLDVLMATTPNSNSCAWVTTYTHPVTLEDFCNEYKDKHAVDTPHGVFPDLYAAYTFNIADNIACAADTGPPDAVDISSPTHPLNQWRNSDLVEIVIEDGADDMSGSYYYRDLWDTNDNTDLTGTWGTGSASFCSKSTTNCTPATSQCTPATSSVTDSCAGSPTWTAPDVHEGDDNYYHVQTMDLAQNLGPTSTYGPVKIDVTRPQFVTPPVFPPPGLPYAIGSWSVHIEWDTTDICTSGCVPSGVDYVQISYDNGLSTITYPPVYEATGSTNIYLHPDLYVPTTNGRFLVTVYDRASNSRVATSDPLNIVRPFEGPLGVPDVTVGGMRTVSGDLDSNGTNGTDEVVVTVASGGTPSLWVIGSFTGILTTSYLGNGFFWGDLFLADTDRDNDLDLIGAGNWGTPGAPVYQVRHFLNTGGSLGGGTTLPVPGYVDMRTRVVDLYGNGEPVLVYTGLDAAGTPALTVYNFATTVSTNGLPGVSPVDGDFEVADIDADGDFDFVMAGTDAGGVAAVTFYEGLGATWMPHVVETLPNIDYVDVDLGNWDADRDAELFVMYEVQMGPVITRHTRLYEWSGSSFVRETSDAEESSIAQGDGHIVDIYNDGTAEVFAMGSPVALLGWQLAHRDEDEGIFGSGLPPTPRGHVREATDTAWGDFDADFSLEPFLVGWDVAAGIRVVEWYRNLMSDHGAPNTPPLPPMNLASAYDVAAGGYVFRWEPPLSTDETADLALGYELRVGTMPGATDIVSWAYPAGPSPQVAPKFYGDHLERFVPLAPGNYFWSVRTVDGGWKRSVPAAEQFTSPAPPDCFTIPGDCDTNGLPDACEPDTDHDGVIDSCDDDDDNDGVPDIADLNPLDPDVCADLDGDGCDDCSIGTDDYGSLADNDPSDDGVDSDGDGMCDTGDPCPADSPDDSDLDGVCDSDDLCPGFNDSVDVDTDGVPDLCDPCPQDNPDDTDTDGICDSKDACPGSDDLQDVDSDGIPDDCDACPLSPGGDSDGDGVCDFYDLCPGGDDSLDADTDGLPDACDGCPNDNPNDSDYDAVCDSEDVCPGGDDFLDTDADGLPNACDPCAGGLSSGDSNGNGFVELGDYAKMNSCLAGPGGSLGPGCACFDFDGDGDNDLVDFRAFQELYVP